LTQHGAAPASATIEATRDVAIHRFERRAMGSPLRLTLVDRVDGDPVAAAADWAVVSADIERSEQSLSRFRADSAITELNVQVGLEPVALESRLFSAVAAAHRAWCRTAGRFDPRIIGHLERLGYHGAPGIAIADSGPGVPPWPSPWLVRDPRRRVVRLGAPIDLGGIGKGLALRWAMAALRRRRAELSDEAPLGVLLEAGGDLFVTGRAPQAGPWLVGVEDPAGGPDLAVVALASGAICTSSTRINRWSDRSGTVVHHLIDPLTGEPGGAGLASVTVAFPDPAWAEVLAKTAFLDGPAGVASRLRGLGLAGWWVDEAGELSMTPAARMMTVWTREEASRGQPR